MVSVRVHGWATPAMVAGAVFALAGCVAQPVSVSPTSSFAAPALQPAPAATSADDATRVVTVGDSLMSGYGLTPDRAWPVLLGERDHLSVINLACAGMGFVVPGECGTPYSGLIPAIAALQPQVLLVESSSNDFWEDPDEIRIDTADTVYRLHAAAPAARIVGVSTIWNDDVDVPDDTLVTSEALRDAVNDVGGTFIDVGQPLAGHPEWMQDDDVHPTARGQRAIEQTVMSALQDANVLP